jgi:outer membrane protein TolC
MLFKTNLQAIILILTLSYGLSPALAQELTLKEIKDKQVAQANPSGESEPSLTPPSVPANVNPSANPLLFPTKPTEVEIENAQSITLDQAIDIALKNNKDLQAARLQLERARAELSAVLAEELPTVDGQVDFSQRANEVGGGTTFFTDTIYRDETTIQGQIEIGYELYTGGRRGANINRAGRQVRFNELDVERIAEDTRFNATDAYYQLQNADAQVAIAQAAVEDFSQTLRDAQLLEQAGLGTRFDVLQAEVDLANANQELTRAIADQRTARRQLAQILSLGQQVELTAANPIEEAGVWSLSLEESIVKAYKNRAELEQFLVQREINEQDREIALSEIRPQVSLFANYNFSNNFNDTFESALGFRDGYAVGARMSWRFFDGGRAFAREDQENRDIDIDETNFANQRDQVRLEVETGYYQLIANKENIGTTEQAVITATESLRLARLRFQAGVGTQTDVINAQRSLTDARGNFLQAIIGYNQSLNQLQRAVSNLPNNHLFELR